MHPKEQFQIGDIVVVKSEGVITKVEGYVWYNDESGRDAGIALYELSCGVSVPRDALRLYENANDGPRPVFR